MRVQISHHTKDVKIASRIADALWTVGIEPRRDYLASPTDPIKRLDSELRKFDFLIALLSPDYMQDEWLGTEYLQSLFREQAIGKPFAIPIVVRGCNIPPSWLRRPAIDFANSSFQDGFASLASVLKAPRQVFVVMKLGDPQLDSAFDGVIRPVLLELGFESLRVDQVTDSNLISEQILRGIEHSAFVLADLSGERPNCYFEAGYAFGLGKEVVLMARRNEPVHFDLAGNRRIEWSTEAELRSELRRWIPAVSTSKFSG